MYNYIVLYCIGFSTCESDSELDYKLDNYIALYCIKISACKSVQNYLCTKILLCFNIVLCRIKWLNCTWESDTEPDPRSIFTFPLQPFNLNIKYKVGIMRKHLYKGRLEKKILISEEKPELKWRSIFRVANKGWDFRDHCTKSA